MMVELFVHHYLLEDTVEIEFWKVVLVGFVAFEVGNLIDKDRKGRFIGICFLEVSLTRVLSLKDLLLESLSSTGFHCGGIRIIVIHAALRDHVREA